MKKRQKIILVISCLALLVSVLAVNCFALVSLNQDYNFNHVESFDLDFHNIQNVDSVDKESICYPGSYFDYDGSIYIGQVNWYGPQIEGFRDYITGDNYDVIRDSLDYNRLDAGAYRAVRFGVDYADYDILNLGNVFPGGADVNLPYRNITFNVDRVLLEQFIHVETWFEFYVQSSDTNEILSAQIHVSSTRSITSNGQYSMTIMGDGAGWNGSVVEFYVDGALLESGTSNADIGDAILAGFISGLSRFSFLSPCPDMPTNLSQSVYSSSASANDFNSWVFSNELIDASYIDSNHSAPTEEIQVDVFDWLVQAVSGILDIELFGGGFTIGSLLLIAMGIPLLIALLRLFSGG